MPVEICASRSPFCSRCLSRSSRVSQLVVSRHVRRSRPRSRYESLYSSGGSRYAQLARVRHPRDGGTWRDAPTRPARKEAPLRHEAGSNGSYKRQGQIVPEEALGTCRQPGSTGTLSRQEPTHGATRNHFPRRAGCDRVPHLARDRPPPRQSLRPRPHEGKDASRRGLRPLRSRGGLHAGGEDADTRRATQSRSKATRNAFQDAVEPEFIEVVETATGRR